MRIRDLIDMLCKVENMHTDYPIDVEIRDDAGFPTLDFYLQQEVHFAAKRVTIRFVPTEEKT